VCVCVSRRSRLFSPGCDAIPGDRAPRLREGRERKKPPAGARRRRRLVNNNVGECYFDVSRKCGQGQVVFDACLTRPENVGECYFEVSRKSGSFVVYSKPYSRGKPRRARDSTSRDPQFSR
jgi:hypothetical protein